MFSASFSFPFPCFSELFTLIPSPHSSFLMLPSVSSTQHCQLTFLDPGGKPESFYLASRKALPEIHMVFTSIFENITKIWGKPEQDTWPVSVSLNPHRNLTFCFSPFFLVPGIEPKALCMLGKYSASELHPHPVICFLMTLGCQEALCWNRVSKFTKLQTTNNTCYNLTVFFPNAQSLEFTMAGT